MINPAWLRSFCALVEIGHFTKTAETLHMTQSGVSQHIAKLEQYLDQPLLLREGKKFTLTPMGQRLYQEGQQLLISLSELDERIGRDPAHEGVVRLASPGSVGLKLYPYLLKLQQQYPALTIEYRFAPNAEIEQLIANHSVDIGIMTSLSGLAEVKQQAIAKEQLLLVTPADVTQPSWSQLLALGLINHPDGAYHASQLLSVNFAEFQHSKQFKQNGFSNQINLILEPVSMGLGFTVLPSHAVAAFHAADNICVHHLPQQVTETIYLGRHSNKFTSNRVKTVVAAVQACLSKPPEVELS